MSNTNIEWTEQSWNPIIGCSKLTEGCDNCYAEKMAFRLSRITSTDYYQTVITDDPNDANHKKWNGKVYLNEYIIREPLKRKKPTTYFISSMGDLFHKEVSFEWIDKVMAVIALCPQHTFKILTKRPKQMLDYFNYMNIENIKDVAYLNYREHVSSDISIPFNNLWIGVSAENQEQANLRIPMLNSIEASVKFVSLEPLISAIDLEYALEDTLKYHAGGLKNCLSWVIVGGETGPKSRPMHPQWAKDIQKQCEKNNIPFFFKQWGEWIDIDNGYHVINESAKPFKKETFGSMYSSHDVFRVGKKKAGNHLNGKTYQEYPTI